MIRILANGLRIHVVQMTRSSFDLLGVTLWPILFATIAYYLYGAKGDPKVLLSASLGATVMAIWTSVTTGASGALDFQRQLGTLELLVAAPAPLVAVLAPITIATATLGVYALVTTLLWGRLLYGVPIAIAHPLVFVLSVPVTIVAIGMLGLILASTMILYRASWFLGNSLEYPGWLATGLLVPISLLPAWVRPVSWSLAPTWGMRALRASALGGGRPWLDLGVCLALSAAYAAVGMLGLGFFERLARERAALALA
jgi:ABC-2 type transport system permease protein